MRQGTSEQCVAGLEEELRQLSIRVDNLFTMFIRIDMEFSLVVTKLREKGILPDSAGGA